MSVTLSVNMSVKFLAVIKICNQWIILALIASFGASGIHQAAFSSVQDLVCQLA